MTGETPDLSAWDVIPYVEPSDEELRASWDFCGTRPTSNENVIVNDSQEVN